MGPSWQKNGFWYIVWFIYNQSLCRFYPLNYALPHLLCRPNLEWVKHGSIRKIANELFYF
jgi:hypothetical protein